MGKKYQYVRPLMLTWWSGVLVNVPGFLTMYSKHHDRSRNYSKTMIAAVRELL